MKLNLIKPHIKGPWKATGMMGEVYILNDIQEIRYLGVEYIRYAGETTTFLRHARVDDSTLITPSKQTVKDYEDGYYVDRNILSMALDINSNIMMEDHVDEYGKMKAVGYFTLQHMTHDNEIKETLGIHAFELLSYYILNSWRRMELRHSMYASGRHPFSLSHNGFKKHSHYRMYRRIGTFQERKYADGHECEYGKRMVRRKRNVRNIPEPWDDIRRSTYKSWKSKKYKHQWEKNSK